MSLEGFRTLRLGVYKAFGKTAILAPLQLDAFLGPTRKSR